MSPCTHCGAQPPVAVVDIPRIQQAVEREFAAKHASCVPQRTCRCCSSSYPLTTEFFHAIKKSAAGEPILDGRCISCRRAVERERYARRRLLEVKVAPPPPARAAYPYQSAWRTAHGGYPLAVA